MAGSRVGLFDNLNIPIHRDAQHREDLIHNELVHFPRFVSIEKPRRPPENASSEVRAFSFGPGLDCVVARSDGSRAVTTTIAQLCHRCELSHQSYGMPALAGITSCNFGLHYVLAAARRQPCTHTIGSACR